MKDSFRLKVQKIEQICLFELAWGKGQHLQATLNYPSTLMERYQEWQQSYLNFYKQISATVLPSALPPANFEDHGLRARVMSSGGLAPTVDWRTRLVEAETQLLSEFHRWLRGAELFEIRSIIARASQTNAGTNQHPIDLFITCHPLEVARFPWEAWEIGADFATTGTIRIIRTPQSIRHQPHLHRRPGRPRILAILGDDTGLDFQVDREAVRRLSRIAEIQFVGWQPGQNPEEVKRQITDAIVDAQGWDILLFAGHSNETQTTGGELAIAPGVSILMREIAPQLIMARDNGLQFALFNSCNGLSLAESLVDLGLSQVAIMREPIHNRVAQEFLMRFLQCLSMHHDVHNALLTACQHLRLEKNLTYPSAYLVPSLFGHPGANWYRMPSWKEQLWHLIPNRLEAVTLATCIILSLIPAVQLRLLDLRMAVQAIYRDVTEQVAPTTSPPITLIQIDRQSIHQAGISQINPIDRTYIASLVQQLTDLNANAIGIDYLFDTPQPSTSPQIPSSDQVLRDAIQAAIQQKSTWFVFASVLDNNKEVGINPSSGIADFSWVLQGFTNADPYHLALLYPQEDCRTLCPFAYSLGLAHLARQDPQITLLPQQQLQSNQTGNQTGDLRAQILDALQRKTLQNPNDRFWEQLRLSTLSVWAYNTLNQYWLFPIIDYSIPPNQVYDRIPAWKILDPASKNEFSNLSHQLVIIGAGTYDQAGLVEGQGDSISMPLAVEYWFRQLQSLHPQPRHAAEAHSWTAPNLSAATNGEDQLALVLTGAEQLTYLTHHLINRHLVIAIPDLWLVVLAVLLGKGTLLLLKQMQNKLVWNRKQQIRYGLGFAGSTAIYGLSSLQLYISGTVLLPWLLPSIVFWIYILPTLRKNK